MERLDLQVGAIDYLDSPGSQEIAIGYAKNHTNILELDYQLLPLLYTMRLNKEEDSRLVEKINLILNQEKPTPLIEYCKSLFSTGVMKKDWGELLDDYLLDNGSQVSEFIQQKARMNSEGSSLRNRMVMKANEFSDSNEIIRYSTERFVSGERKYVGGLADRIKGAATAFMIALGTQRRFEIEWIQPHLLTDLYRPIDYDWLPRGEWDEERVIDIVDGRFKPEVRENVRTASINEWLSVRHPNTRVHCNIFEKNLLANQSCGIHPSDDEWTQEEIIGVFLSMFEYRPNLEESAMLSLFITHLKSFERTIAMHFRTGGDGEWSDPVMDDRANVEKIISKAKELSRDTNSCVLFATDSNKLKDAVLSKYREDLNMFCIDLPIAHVDRSYGDDAVRGSRMAVMENHMITLCDHILAGKGAFSVLAANRKYEMPWRYYRDK